MKTILNFFWVTILSIFIGSSQVFACSVCYGDPNSRMTQGLKMAVLALLLTVTAILALFVVAVLQMRKRSHL